MQNEGAQCSNFNVEDGLHTPGIGLEPVPLPHTDRRADGKGEEGSPIMFADDICCCAETRKRT